MLHGDRRRKGCFRPVTVTAFVPEHARHCRGNVIGRLDNDIRIDPTMTDLAGRSHPRMIESGGQPCRKVRMARIAGQSRREGCRHVVEWLDVDIRVGRGMAIGTTCRCGNPCV